MEREDRSPHIEVRPIDLDADRGDLVEFGGADERRSLPGAAKWLVAVAVLVAALIFYIHATGAPAPIAAPPPSPNVASGLIDRTPVVIPTGTSDGPTVVQVGRPLFGATSGWELFGRSYDALIRIQPALGRISVTRVPPLGSSAPATLLATSTSALIVSYDNVVGYAIPDGRPAHVLSRELHLDGEPIAGPDPDHVWVLDSNETHLVLVDLSGKPTGPRLALPHDADVNGEMADGSGYPLVETPRGAFDLRPGGTILVTTAQVLAAGPIGWLVVGDCDSRQQCSMVMVNRATGSRREIAPYRYLAPATPGVISPDGRHAAMLALNGEGGGQVYLVDLTSGTGHLLDVSVDENAADAMVWSPDSKWLFVADGGITPVDAATATVVAFDNPWGEIDQLAVRSG